MEKIREGERKREEQKKSGENGLIIHCNHVDCFRKVKLTTK